MPTQTQQVETILKLNVDYETGIKSVGAYITEIKKLKDEQKDLDKAFKAGAISEQQYGDAMAKNKTVTTQLNGEMKVLTTELKKKLEYDRAEAKQIDINIASYNELSKTYTQMKKRINEMDAAERARNKAYIDQSKQVYERMKALQAETGKMQLNVGNYQAAITQAITGNSKFASSLMGIAGGANTASGALGIVNKNALAASEAFMTLLTNPVFLAIAGIAGAGMAFKWWQDYNEGVAEAMRLTKQFTGATGEDLNAIRSSVQAVADTFGKDFKETLQAVDTLSSQFKMDWQEASDLIAQGFAAGADVNGDFLANIKQYGPALKDAGLSAEELVAVIQQTRSGVFSKDGLDAITKASKSLRDMSNSTADSLRGIGINADELKNKLANGSITMMQAIQQVSEHLKGVGANTQEAGAIINDVFGKKGVSAGQEQIKAIADLEMQLDSLIEKEGEYGKIQQQLYEVQKVLNEETFALFGTEGWDEMKKKSELYGKALLVYVLNNLIRCYNAGVDFYNFMSKAWTAISSGSVAVWSTAWNAARTFFTLVQDAGKAFAGTMKGVGTIVEGVFTFDWDKVTNGWNNAINSLTGSWRHAVITAREYGASVGKAFASAYNATVGAGGAEYLTLGGGSGSTAGGGSSLPIGGGGGSSAGGGGKSGKTGKSGGSSSTAAADREAAALAKATERAQQMLLKNYDAYTKQRVAAEQKRIELMLATVKKGSEEELMLRQQQLDQQQMQEQASIEQSVQDEMERAYLVQLVYEKYAKQRAELVAQYQKQQDDTMAQAVANDFTTRIQAAADNELEQERIKLEQLAYLRDNARQMEGESIEAFNARRLELEQDYLDQKKALADKEVQVQQVKLEAYSTIAGGIAKVFEAMGDSESDFAKISKVLALAEIAINTGKAIAAGVAQAQSVPFPGNIAAIATTVATIMANIATAIATVKSAHFAKGGLITGPGTGKSDSITAKVSNGESIMTANATALFSPLLSAINQMGGGVPIPHHGGASSQMGEDMLAAAIAKGYAMAPAPVVSVEEITDVSNRVQVIENMARS